MTKYVVQGGDTLGHIALRETEGRATWMELYKANKRIIDEEARRRHGGNLPICPYEHIYPGTELTLP